MQPSASARAIVAAWLALILCANQAGAKEIIVDDFDRNQIKFQPEQAWKSQSDSVTRDRYMGTTTWTDAVGASATFTFTGTSISFISYGDPVAYEDRGETAFDINLDGTHYVGNTYIDGTQAQAQRNVFSQNNLDGTRQHTIIITKTQNNTRGINVDAFLYTVDDAPSAAPSQTSAPSSQADSGNQVPVAAIAGGAVGAVVLGVALGFLVWYLRNRSSSKTQTQTQTNTFFYAPSTQHTPYTPTYPSSSTGPGSLHFATVPSTYSGSLLHRPGSSDPLNARQGALSPASFAHTLSTSSGPYLDTNGPGLIPRRDSLAFSALTHGRESVLPPYPMTPAPMSPPPPIQSPPISLMAEARTDSKSPIPLG